MQLKSLKPSLASLNRVCPQSKNKPRPVSEARASSHHQPMTAPPPDAASVPTTPVTLSPGINRAPPKPGEICFLASDSPPAQEARKALVARYGEAPLAQARVVVALGGDGFMLQTLHALTDRDVPVYGMNRGTVGFLMNDFSLEALPERIARAQETVLNPLRMQAKTLAGTVHEALAINEVSLLRMGPQAARLRIYVDGKVRLDELVCDGALVATPAGSTAYNYSAHGPILPLGAEVLALTAIAAFRPRRWRGALLPKMAKVRFEVLEPEKRPVMAEADAQSVREVTCVDVETDPTIRLRLLHDAGHGLEERIIREQFV